MEILPYSPKSPLFDLPSELLLLVLDNLPPEPFISFMFASYDFMSYKWPDICPLMTPASLKAFLTTPSPLAAARNPFMKMPTEMILAVIKNLARRDWMRFAMANYHVLEEKGIAPPMTAGTRKQLERAAVRELICPLTPVSSMDSTDPGAEQEAPYLKRDS